MHCDNCKGWFHEACTDLTSTAYKRLRKSDRKWVCVTCSTDAVVLLSNIIVLLTCIRNKLSVNLDNDSKKTGRQTRAFDGYKNRDVDRYTIDGASINTNDDVSRLSTIITSKVLDSPSKLESPAQGPEIPVGDSTQVKKAQKNQASPPKPSNLSVAVQKLTGDLVAQSTHKTVRPVKKEPEPHKRTLTSKQQVIKHESAVKPGKLTTVRDDSLITMNLVDNPDLFLSLQDKNDRMLWGELNKKLELPRIEPLMVTQLSRGKDSKHLNHPRLLRVTLKNAIDIEDVLLASHLLKSDGNVRILPDIPFCERNIIRNIPKESREKFFRGRNIIVQGIPENADPTQSNSDIREWKFIKQSLRLKHILTQHVTRLAKKDGDLRPRQMKITFPSSQMAAAVLEAFRANRHQLPPGIHMHPDRPYEARIKHKGKLELTIPLVDCLNDKKTCKGQGLPPR
ncbi:unnamed protein product [Schistosoma margrebowiei]|uniref:Uncharacterized protein n=1 Tax=Schistosoma margrebowiei TaxID=48269 RepID=A0A183N9J1_9TREM|nr:unnamed protein product [Schistosoma margrebowiei]